jgi:hypothetical protein
LYTYYTLLLEAPIKSIQKDSEAIKFRFVKDAESYNRKIAVAKPKVDKSKKIFAEYKTKNPDTVDMW